VGYYKRGSRQDFICDACGKVIVEGTPYYREDKRPFNRYHLECDPAKKPIVEEKVETIKKTESDETSEIIQETNSEEKLRDAKGQFIKKSG